MSWSLAVAGTVHRDDITTPHGSVESLGGSAIFFALAASRTARVLLNGIVGRDCVDELHSTLAGRDIDLQGLVVSEAPTFVWHVVHDFERWITSSESADEGCDPEWQPRLPGPSAGSHVLFLASMRPSLQRAVLDQSRAGLIAADTMTVYTESDCDSVSDVAQCSDLLFLNRAELASLTGDADWLSAARSLIGRGRTRAIVVKRGPAGAALVTATRLVEQPAHPVQRVVDPTGAGDALAGGFLAHCARAEREDAGIFPDALSAGLECAAQAVSAFGTAGLRELGTGQ